MSPSRDSALDFAKGAAVTAMLVHHSIDYFAVSVPAIRFVRFVSGAFLLLSGFLVTRHLIRRDTGAEGLSRRLAVRGWKLLLLFAFLNLCMAILKYNVSAFASLTPAKAVELLYTAFIEGDYRVISFEILVPIAYTLLVLSLLLKIRPFPAKLLILGSAVLLLVCSVAYLRLEGGYYLRHTTIGLIGASLGLIKPETLKKMQGHLLAACAVYALYLAYAVAGKFYFPVYVLIVVINCAFFYVAGSYLEGKPAVEGSVNLLGRHSLFAYIFQIGVLYVLHRALPEVLRDWRIGFVCAAATTFFVTLEVERCSNRWPLCRKAYRGVFG